MHAESAPGRPAKVAPRSVVLGMGDGSMTTLTIADPEKPGIADFLKSLPSRLSGA